MSVLAHDDLQNLSRKHRLWAIIGGYALLLGLLALCGSYYTLRDEGDGGYIAAAASHGNVAMAYYDLPRMTVAVGHGAGAGISQRIQIDLALEVEKKDVKIIEGFQSRITDRLNGFLSGMTAEQIERPSTLPWLREQLLIQINSAGAPAAVKDLMFRQLVIM